MWIKLQAVLWVLSVPAIVHAETFGLEITVAAPGRTPVVSDDWIRERVETAVEIFAPAELSFTYETTFSDPSLLYQVETRADRHRFGPRVDAARGTIHIFIVESLADVDITGRALRGVHWRSRRGGGPRHFVILSTLAGPEVLAHELGHFFGNPHSDTPGNIMSYTQAQGPRFFDTEQIRRIRRYTRLFVDSGELRPR